MAIKVRNNFTNRYSSITYYGIVIVIFIHLLGYLNLREWLIFSGIGPEANRIDDQFGYAGLALLNASALFTFIPIAGIYNHKSKHPLFLYSTYAIVVVFILRGLVGYVFVVRGEIGSATPLWEFIFSTLAFIIGV